MPAAFRPDRAVIDVAVAVLRDSAGRVLLAQRLPRQLSPGYWELPGGKVDPGETPQQAAVREAAEEVGVQIAVLAPLVRYEHRFPLRRLRLHFFVALDWRGQPHGREGQQVAWVESHRPAVAPVLPSNHRALALLGLPPQGLAAPAACIGDTAWLAGQVGSGRQLLLADLGGANAEQQSRQLGRSRGWRTRHGLPTLVRGGMPHLARADADGWCTADPARRWLARPDVPLWAAECRDVDEARRFAALGADIGLFDPQRWTASGLSAAASALPAAYAVQSGEGGVCRLSRLQPSGH